MTEFKEIPGCLNYAASRDGRIMNLKKRKVLDMRKGLYFRFHVGNKLMNVHRAVCLTYLPNPENKPCINHKDGNKHNNHVDNLEWCTYQENTNHAYEHKLRVGPKSWLGKFGGDHHSSKTVVQLKDDVVLNTWPSVIEAAKDLNIQKSGIALACRKVIKRYKGYDWQYA